MRRFAWLLLLIFVFTIPWEYSLDLGAPFGNVARFTGILVLLAAIPAILQKGKIKIFSPLHWAVLALFLWFCCTCFWTVDSVASLAELRGFLQEIMIVWLVWEIAETPLDLRMILRAWVAGSWVLAILTLANFSSPQAIALGQYRFAAYGQDPNDVARFLDLGFPLAALLANSSASSPHRVPGRALDRILDRASAIGYLPLGLVAVLLTASRGGFLAAIVALAGCALLLARGHSRAVLAAIFALPAFGAALWFAIPRETFQRLATIPQQLQSGDLNQRLNIWSAGWHAFTRAPLIGAGFGTFVNAAGVASIDTAHNTALSILVGGGLVALFLATVILVLAARSAFSTLGSLRIALLFSLLVWAVTSLVATVEESRTTWLLLAVIVLAGRLAADNPAGLAATFPDSGKTLAFPDSALKGHGITAW